jgi:uncharacterized protein (TIGR02246 family)
MSTTLAPDVTGTTPDEDAVRALYARLLDAWCRGDGRAYADCFVADADYVAFDGSHTRGREAIGAWHQQLFDTWLKGTRLVGQITGLGFARPDVAIVHATGGTITRGRAKPSAGRDSIQTLVAARDGDEWRFVAFHNTRVRPRSRLGNLLFGFATRVMRR